MTAHEELSRITRRHFFGSAGFGLGAAALGSLLGRDLGASEEAGPHSAPRARSVIFLFMRGGPSQLDLFEDKPELRRRDGQAVPEEMVRGRRFAFIKGATKMLAGPRTFARHGRSGAVVSDLLPHLASAADDVAFVKSMHTDHFNHAPAQILMNSGHILSGRPSMGAWTAYGLGSESRDLPAFMVLVSGPKGAGAGSGLWTSGFLPPQYQGVELRSQSDAVACVCNPAGMSPEVRRRSLDTLGELNRERLIETGDPEVAARIAAYEMAFRMQTSVPDLMDLSREPAEVHAMYGTEPGKASFANNCLLARRMVERGVRFVQLYHGGWDHHGGAPEKDIVSGLAAQCRETDRASAALIRDLKRRGLLDQTLVVWLGEFGRTPMSEQADPSRFPGRDHHPHAFSMWMAGGGIRPGVTIGATDPLGYSVTEDPVHVHDLHATALHLLGIDHRKLTYRFQGRDYRLTDVHGKIVPKLLA